MTHHLSKNLHSEKSDRACIFNWDTDKVLYSIMFTSLIYGVVWKIFENWPINLKLGGVSLSLASATHTCLTTSEMHPKWQIHITKFAPLNHVTHETYYPRWRKEKNPLIWYPKWHKQGNPLIWHLKWCKQGNPLIWQPKWCKQGNPLIWHPKWYKQGNLLIWYRT